MKIDKNYYYPLTHLLKSVNENAFSNKNYEFHIINYKLTDSHN